MASLINTMALEPLKRFSFVVDNTVAEVSLVADPAAFLSLNGLGVKYFFPAADNILILSLGIRLPHCFEMARDMPVVALAWVNAAETISVSIVDLNVPFKDQFISLSGSNQDGLFAAHYSIVGAVPGASGKINVGFAAGATTPKVSMIGAPDILNGTTQYVDFFAVIQHQVAVAVA